MNYQKSQWLQIILISATLFLSLNGTLVDGDDKNKRPDVNFYGTIEDHTKSFYAEDILIEGKYESIAVYPVISKSKRVNTDDQKSLNPKQNKALIDLKEIQNIELKHPDHPTASTIEINNRNYIEIVVTSITGTKKNYLVESSRNVTCKEVDKGPENKKQEVFTERKLSMIHVKKMTIKGPKANKQSDAEKHYPRSHDKGSLVSEKKAVSKNTEKILDQIEENVKNLSQDNASAFEKMKSTILTLLKSLREQLQKILDMLQ